MPDKVYQIDEQLGPLIKFVCVCLQKVRQALGTATFTLKNKVDWTMSSDFPISGIKLLKAKLFIVDSFMSKIRCNKYVQKSTLERHTILVGFYANACQGRRQCCCYWTFYIKNGRVIPMGPLLVVGLPLPLPCLPAFPMMYISPESASSTWQYWPVVAAFSHLVSSSPFA